MKRDTKWKIEYRVPPMPAALIDAGYNPLLAIVLSLRGFDTVEKAKKLLDASSDTIHNPRQILDMDKAVVRVKKAIQNGEKIALFGDYDVDGITATALLTDYLQSRGVNVTPYIPSRNNEGYGLNTDALQKFKDDGITLVITVDCGITSIDEAKFASDIGLDLIITDHHECKGSQIPECCAVIDCKRENDSYPYPYLAGVGMAFKLVCAIDGHPDIMLKNYCDLLAVGTVADVMPLTDENRVFVKYGLKKLKNNPRIGINAIMKEAEISIDTITASTISYVLAPRLNAAGRLGDAITAEKLLLCQDEKEASELAAELCRMNKERQSLENQIWQEATSFLDGQDTTKPIVIAKASWHPGVIGIAASRLSEHFGVPAIIICLNGDEGDCTGKGSCRSSRGFNLFDALQFCSDSLISFGGHPLAAGLNIRKDSIDIFRKKLCEYYESHSPAIEPCLKYDYLITDPSILSIENVKSLDQLEPYGNENAKPVFCMLGALLEQYVPVGSGKHLKLKICFADSHFDCIFFNCNEDELGLKRGEYIDIAFTPQINEFHGNATVQLTLCAAKKHDSNPLCNDIKSNCTYIDALKPYRPSRVDFVKLWKKSGEEIVPKPYDMIEEKYWICRKVFEDCGLIDNAGKKTCTDPSQKTDLTNSDLMKALNEQ